MTINKRLMIVDDDPERNEELIIELKEVGYEVESVNTGEDAVVLFDNAPEKYDFVLIDHLLGSTEVLDGIKTCKKIYDRSNDVIIVIYSNIPSDNPETIQNFKENAYKAGAKRYIRRTQDDTPIELLSEMNNIMELSQQLVKLHEFQKNLPFVLNSMNNGVMLIDNESKIWYISPEIKTIFNIDQYQINNPCYKELYNFKNKCSWCPQNLSNLNEKIILQYIKGKDELRYLKLSSESILDNNRRQIAVLELIQDISNTSFLNSLDIKKRLIILAQSLYDHDDLFEHVIIYIKEGDRYTVKAVCKHSEDNVDKVSYRVDDALKTGHIRDTIDYYKKNRKACFFYEPIKEFQEDKTKKPFIQFPVMEGEDTLALIQVNGNRSIKDKDNSPIWHYYSNEIKKIIFDSKKNKEEYLSLNTFITKIESEIMLKSNVDEIIQFFIDYIKEYTKSISCHIRYRKNNFAYLLPIYNGEYPKNAKEKWDISRKDSVACRVILSGHYDICNDTENNDRFKKLINGFNDIQKEAIKGAKSYCCMPLHFMDDCIGVLVLYSDKTNHYNSKEYLPYIKEISKRLSVALHDYLKKEETEKTEKEKNKFQQEDKKKTEFIQILAHELKTPLTSIICFTDLLIKSKLPEKQKKMAMIVNNESQRYARMVNKLVLHCRMESGKIIPDNKSFSIIELINNCIKMMTPPAMNKNIEILLKILLKDNNVMLYGDKDLLYQVFINLIDNAIKFSSNKKDNNIKIIVNENNENFIISVKDKGSGISEEALKHIFDPFYQGDPYAFPGTVSGSGIGLSLVKYIIEDIYKGKITVISKIGKGSTFNIIIPKIEYGG